MSEEQKQNYQKDIDRFEEGKFASQNSFPTKLLGWMLIAGFGFQIAGAVSNTYHDFGGVILLIAGASILKGSSAWLRFVTFFIVPSSIIGMVCIVWSIVRNEPIEAGRKWVDYGDLAFWTLGVSPNMYFAAASILAACAFRLRKIPFWTKTVRWSAVIVGTLFLLRFGFFVRNLVCERQVRRTFSEDLQSARTLISRGGTTTLTPTPFTASPQVLRIAWRQGSSCSREFLYQAPPRKPSKSERLYEYEEWVKDPSGKWGKLEMSIVLPTNP